MSSGAQTARTEDQIGQTGGVVEMLAAALDRVVYTSMTTCWDVLQWQPGTDMIKSLNSTMTLSGGHITIMIQRRENIQFT